jgi:hypothetical protein
MSNFTSIHNVGSYVVPITSVFPESAAAGTINGSSIDRALHNMPQSCVLHQVAGAESGAPTTTSVQTTLQHSPDNSTWSNYQIGTTVQQTAALTAASTENTASIDLAGAYRFIRAVTAVAFTGGTSPAVLVAADIILGGERELAAV